MWESSREGNTRGNYTRVYANILSRIKCVRAYLSLALLNGKEHETERGDVKRTTLEQSVSLRNGKRAAKIGARSSRERVAWRSRNAHPSLLQLAYHTVARIPTYPRYATIPTRLPVTYTIFPRYTSLGRDAPIRIHALKYACSDLVKAPRSFEMGVSVTSLTSLTSQLHFVHLLRTIASVSRRFPTMRRLSSVTRFTAIFVCYFCLQFSYRHQFSINIIQRLILSRSCMDHPMLRLNETISLRLPRRTKKRKTSSSPLEESRIDKRGKGYDDAIITSRRGVRMARRRIASSSRRRSNDLICIHFSDHRSERSLSGRCAWR